MTTPLELIRGEKFRFPNELLDIDLTTPYDPKVALQEVVRDLIRFGYSVPSTSVAATTQKPHRR
jgi:hypothetical protein